MKVNHIILCLFFLALLGCSDDEITEADQLTKDINKIEQYISDRNIQNVISTASGLHYVTTIEGDGDLPGNGQTVSVHYTGKFLDDEVFDSSVTRGEPLEFEIGSGFVIDGFEEGVRFFNKGAIGSIFLPSSLAYGKNGSGGIIGPNEVLIFDIEIVDIN